MDPNLISAASDYLVLMTRGANRLMIIGGVGSAVILVGSFLLHAESFVPGLLCAVCAVCAVGLARRQAAATDHSRKEKE
jgi:hypothetical protein